VSIALRYLEIFEKVVVTAGLGDVITPEGLAEVSDKAPSATGVRRATTICHDPSDKHETNQY
jgi:hypothetical protein